jgi:ATP-dependent DNA helicase PIF1
MEQMQLQGIIRDISFFRDRAILITKNDTVADINVRILTRLVGETRVYDAVDSISFNTMEESNRPDVSIEFLRAQNPSGLPPARLELKIGALIICLRNLFPREGLCNGTRIIISKLREYFIEVKIINGQFHGEDRVIPRITLIADMEEGAWKHNRK